METTEVLSIVARAKEQDQAAFGQLYDFFAPRLYRFISYKIATREQAEDVLQETFLKAWKALPKLSLENLNFSAWLYRIARNLINDHYRALQRRPAPDTIENHYDLSSPDNVMEHVAQGIDVGELKELIETLPSNYKQILELRYLQQFSIEETAKIIGKTTVAVRVAQHRAIKKLHSFLKPLDNETT